VTREERLERLSSIARSNTIAFEKIDPRCWPDNDRLLSYFALMVGALYALRCAIQLNYEFHNSSSQLYVSSCHQSLVALSNAQDNIPKVWAAGHYLNSAIHRVSSLCESISENEFKHLKKEERKFALRDKFPESLARIYKRRNHLIHVSRSTISNEDIIDVTLVGLENLSDEIARISEKYIHGSD
jgi:hypothetical protein